MSAITAGSLSFEATRPLAAATSAGQGLSFRLVGLGKSYGSNRVLHDVRFEVPQPV